MGNKADLVAYVLKEAARRRYLWSLTSATPALSLEQSGRSPHAPQPPWSQAATTAPRSLGTWHFVPPPYQLLAHAASPSQGCKPGSTPKPEEAGIDPLPCPVWDTTQHLLTLPSTGWLHVQLLPSPPHPGLSILTCCTQMMWPSC